MKHKTCEENPKVLDMKKENEAVPQMSRPGPPIDYLARGPWHAYA